MLIAWWSWQRWIYGWINHSEDVFVHSGLHAYLLVALPVSNLNHIIEFTTSHVEEEEEEGVLTQITCCMQLQTTHDHVHVGLYKTLLWPQKQFESS